MSASLIERLRMGTGSSPDHHLLMEAADALERISRRARTLCDYDDQQALADIIAIANGSAGPLTNCDMHDDESY